MEPPVLLERKGAVAEIVLNRPDQLNAMNLELMDGFVEAVRGCQDPKIRAVVLKGNGRCFCAGGDVRFFKQQLESGKALPQELPDRLHAGIEQLRALEKPVLASVHGAAAGAGSSLALACDLVIAAEEAVFTLAYTKIGLSPDGSSSFFLPRHVGLKKAMELFLLSPTLKANEAIELGWVNWVVPAGTLPKKTAELATQLAAGPTLAFARVKKLLNQSYTSSLHDQLALESRFICESSVSADFREGIAAFLEKRNPAFQGS